MAEKFLNNTGLTYFYNRIKTLFAKQTDLTALTTKVDDIIAEGGEPNTIETVKVNGTALVPDAQKAVNVQTPVMSKENSGAIAVSDSVSGCYVSFTNSSDGAIVQIGNDAPSRELVDKNYVDNNAGKIDKIKANGVEQTITNKEVNLSIPIVNCADGLSGATELVRITQGDGADGIAFQKDTNGVSVKFGEGRQSGGTQTVVVASKEYTDNTFRTESQVQDAIDASLADITGIDFQVVDALPTQGVKGVIYLLHNSASSPNSYDEYIWITPATGDPHYEKIGTTDVDLSNYWNNTNLVAITTEEIDAIIDAA